MNGLCASAFFIWKVATISRTFLLWFFALVRRTYKSCLKNHITSLKDFSRVVWRSKQRDRDASVHGRGVCTLERRKSWEPLLGYVEMWGLERWLGRKGWKDRLSALRYVTISSFHPSNLRWCYWKRNTVWSTFLIICLGSGEIEYWLLGYWPFRKKGISIKPLSLCEMKIFVVIFGCRVPNPRGTRIHKAQELMACLCSLLDHWT